MSFRPGSAGFRVRMTWGIQPLGLTFQMLLEPAEGLLPGCGGALGMVAILLLVVKIGVLGPLVRPPLYTFPYCCMAASRSGAIATLLASSLGMMFRIAALVLANSSRGG